MITTAYEAETPNPQFFAANGFRQVIAGGIKVGDCARPREIPGLSA